MIRFLVALLFCFSSAAQASDTSWFPPENPDPNRILQEARADRQAGRYAQSLAKHVWYHENALKIQPSQYGVRLSFALSDWRQLANRYPPALDSMSAFRDRAERRVKENKDDRAAFHDAASLNSELKDEDRTVHLFRWLDENDPTFATSVFSIARDTLIEQQEFELCGKYVGDADSFRSELDQFEEMTAQIQQYGDADSVDRMVTSQRQYMVYSMSNDIATLVRIGRSDDAVEAGNLLLGELSEPILRQMIERAMGGEFPDLGELMTRGR